MEFCEYWRPLSAEEKERFAAKVGRDRDYLRQVASGHVRAGWKLARNIETATLGRVPAAGLRPDVFGR